MTADFTNLPIRDIHLPDPVSWWPPAPGWWALLLLFILAVVTGFWWLKQRMKKQRLYKSAMDEMERLEQQFLQDNDSRQLVESLSVLLRRVSLSCYPKTEIASLTGIAWLEFLNQAYSDSEQPLFSSTQGKALLEAPFNPRLEVNTEALLSDVRAWMQVVTRRERQR